jgi:hypothetical protein
VSIPSGAIPMTDSQEPPGPRRSRRLGPDELARDLANRLKTTRDPDAGGRRFLPHFDMLNAGRLILGLGALLILAGLVFGFTWLSGLAGYQTTGTVSETSPVYGCPGEPELGKVFAGESITLIGRSADQVWLAVRDQRGPGDTVYVLASVVEVDGDASLFSARECQPSAVLPVAIDQTTLGGSPASTGVVATTTTPTASTFTETTATSDDSGLPGTTGANPRNPTTTTTTFPFPVAPPPSTTTTQPTTTTTGSSTTSSTQSTTTSPPTTGSTTTTLAESTTTATTETTTTETTTTLGS